jgi:hypothetical protein
MVSREAETFKNSGLGRKLQEGHRISLTTPYLVYILSGNTKYRYFVEYLIFKDLNNKGGEKEKVICPLFNNKYLILLTLFELKETERFYAN